VGIVGVEGMRRKLRGGMPEAAPPPEVIEGRLGALAVDRG
jgi:hypothetical protein